MKKQDIVFILGVVLLLSPFFIFSEVYQSYASINKAHPFVMSFVKFGILSTLGEIIGLRIRSGRYYQQGFGILPRVLVWGVLGVGIKMAFVIFGAGAPRLLAALGVIFPTADPAAILNQSFFVSYSGLQLLAAFAVSVTLNTIFAPVFMTLHKITDTHILENGGTLAGFFRPIPFVQILENLDWKVQWNFVFKRTIPLFWYPAHTVTFLLPPEMRILFAAVLGVVLGILLSVASLKSRN